MPQLPSESNERMSLRIAAKDKALLMRAASLQQVNLTDFVVHNAVEIAQKIINESEQINLTERDSLKVLELLDNPPPPNAKLTAAAFALPKQS